MRARELRTQPGAAQPVDRLAVQLVRGRPATSTPADAAAFARLADTLRTEPGIAAVSAPAAGRGTSLISVTPATSPEAKATSTLISQLRDSVIPAAEHGTTLRVYVGGVTAVNDDFAAVIAPKLLIFIGVVLVLGFLLLLTAFHSLLIPAVAAVMNLLAAAASFGVLVAVFQYGWGLRLLNLGQPGPVESFLPVLMLAVLFGLSMDYGVFLVSRIRTVLVPAVMHLSGRANWWLPAWLDRILPHLSIEPATQPPALPAPGSELTRSTTVG